MATDWRSVCGIDPFGIPLTVLHVAQPVDGGVAGYARAVSQFQARSGWRVAVAGGLDPDPGSGVHVLRWTARRSPIQGTLSEQRTLHRIVDRVRPDVVVLHSAKAGLVGRLALRGRIPTVYVPHAWSFYALPAALRPAAVGWERVAAGWTNALVAVSRTEAEDAARLGIAVPTFLVPNPAPASPRLPTVRGGGPAPTVVCVGRLSRQKGQDLLLAAWPRVTSRVPGARLVLVGDGPWRARLERGAPAGVSFAGTLADPWHSVPADVAVLPSRWEGMSLAMLEAMAHGLPVVMTRVGGYEVVEKAGAGESVRLGDSDALATALVTRLLDPERGRREGAAGAAAVRRDHAPEVSYRALSAVVARAYAFGRVRPS